MSATTSISKSRRKRPVAGPMSRTSALATIDKRTKAGRYFRDTVTDLVRHVGGTPTVAQRILIGAVALKATRLFLASERMLTEEIAETTDHQMLAWANSMRRDLNILGIAGKAEGPKSLAQIMSEA